MNKVNLENIKTSFNSLNPKELHNWPVWANVMVGVCAFVAVFGGGFGITWVEQMEKVEKLKKAEIALKETYIDKKKQAVNLEDYKNQLKEITIASDALLKQLPNRSEMDKLLIDINQAAVTRGLTIELFKPNTERLTEYYAELPISVKVLGTYENLGNFTSDVSNLSRVVLFDEIKVSETKSNGIIAMELRAKTFRYLDQDEIEKQRAVKAAEKAAEKKKKKKK